MLPPPQKFTTNSISCLQPTKLQKPSLDWSKATWALRLEVFDYHMRERERERERERN